MKYVLDASVALCWVIPRPLTSKAIGLRDEYLRGVHQLIAPAIFIDEVAGALTKAERQKDVAIGQAAPLYVKIINSSPILIAHAPLIARALEISSRTRSGYYDCLYVALAESQGCKLVTAQPEVHQ
jgi:predicted nucleic acid-binding protein